MSYYPLATGEPFPGTRNNVSESALLLLLFLYYGYSSVFQHSSLVSLPYRIQSVHIPHPQFAKQLATHEVAQSSSHVPLLSCYLSFPPLQPIKVFLEEFQTQCRCRSSWLYV